MSRRIDDNFKNSLKALMPAYLLAKHGIQNPVRKFCSPWRDDRHPTCSMDSRTYRVRDWALDESYDVYSLVEKDFHVTNLYDQAKIICDITGAPFPYDDTGAAPERFAKRPFPPGTVKRRVAYPKPEQLPTIDVWDSVLKSFEALFTPQGANARRYLESRGFGEDSYSMTFFGWVAHPSDIMPGFDYAPHDQNGYICLPFPQCAGSLIPVQYATFRPLFNAPAKEYKPKGIQAPIFQEYRLQEPGKLFVTEGIFDAYSFEILNRGTRTCALCGSNKNRLLQVLYHTPNNMRPDIILALDSDSAGQKMAASLRDDLMSIGVRVGMAPPYPAGCKDANDVLMLRGCAHG